MSLLAALVAGALLGMRHAVETDHVAAVAALVERGADRPGLVGASWGVGHSVPVAAVGLAFLFFGVELPPLVFSVVEGVVGALLVVLGVRLLLGAESRLRHAHDDSTENGHDHDHVGVGSLLVGFSHTHRSTHAHEHRHGTDEGEHSLAHNHPHVHGVDGDGDGDGDHSHPALGLSALDVTGHTHDDEESDDEPLSLDTGGVAVGAVHGLAGSGALVVALVATAPSFDNAVAFLGGFSLLSVLTMATVSAVWGRALETRGHELLTTLAGAVGVVVGLLLLAEVAGVASLFSTF